MNHPPLRLLCVDDHEFLAAGLRARLDREPDIEFIGHLPDASQLMEAAQKERADLVLLDIEMPGPDPFEALAELSRRAPETRVIMFSAYTRDHYIDAAFNAGAWGYLSKSDDPDTVVNAIRMVHRGEFAFGPSVLERFPPKAPGAKPVRPTSRLDLLTPRELQILRMIGRGLSRTEIAKEVHRSPKTIDNHRAAIMEKLGIHDRVDLVRYAISEGLTEV